MTETGKNMNVHLLKPVGIIILSQHKKLTNEMAGGSWLKTFVKKKRKERAKKEKIIFFFCLFFSPIKGKKKNVEDTFKFIK